MHRLATADASLERLREGTFRNIMIDLYIHYTVLSLVLLTPPPPPPSSWGPPPATDRQMFGTATEGRRCSTRDETTPRRVR